MDSDKSPILSNQDDVDVSIQQHQDPPAVSQAESETTYVTVHPVGPDDVPPPYSPSPDGSRAESQTTYVTVHPIGPDDIPPPYSPPDGPPMIACKVCGFLIDITEKKDYPFVKCSSCNETTPIKDAPPGKMFVRCTCQSLLVCKSGSQILICPRSTCKRLLNVEPLPTKTVVSNVPGICHVSCAHCGRLFTFSTLANVLAICVHCGKVSSVGKQFARKHGMMYLIAAFLFLVIGLGATVGVISDALKDICFYMVFGSLLGRAIYYFAMKVSKIENPA